MTPAQLIYLSAVAVYVIFFFLFARFFLWKRYADSNYWNRRPKLSLEKVTEMAQGAPLPYISVLVPARNEADVIEKTVDHMAKLKYPRDRYEVVVVTDEKEVQAADAVRPRVVAATANFLTKGGPWPAHLNGQGEGIIIGLLSQLSLEECGRLGDQYDRWIPLEQANRIPTLRLLTLIRETATRMVKGKGKVNTLRLFRVIRRTLDNPGDDQVYHIYPILLSLAMPAVVAMGRLKREQNEKLVWRMVTHTARAHHSLTREILYNLTEALSRKIIARVERLKRRGELEAALGLVYRDCYPTTQDIMERKVREFELGSDVPAVKHLIVPDDFDGKVGGGRLGRPVPSTKGRALNFAFSFIDRRTEMCGFYDAESRPDPRVLLFVAFRRLQDRGKVQILQGPVFQVRNFYEMNPICKIASLYQALAHDWYLPALFRKLPFVGGTNLFVDADLVRRIGGYDPSSLTEDLELGTRAYLEVGAWPEYLPYPSSEQTPPSIKAFYRQRLRWGTGHLQVMDKIRRDTQYPLEKRRALLRELFRKGQMEWVVYQGATFVPPTVLVLYWNGMVDAQILPEAVRWGLNVLSLIYIGFTMYAFFRYSEYLDASGRPRRFLGHVGVISQLFFLPVAAFIFPLPYSSALVLKMLNKQPKTWTKTPRTRE